MANVRFKLSISKIGKSAVKKSSKRIIWNGPDMKLVMVCVEPDKLRSTLVTWYENRICCLLYRRKDQHKRDPRPLLFFFQ